MNYLISALPAFSDNYIWVIQSESGYGIVIDPGDAKPVQSWIKQQNIQLIAILITHHHPDHTAGVKTLQAETGAEVYAPTDKRINCAYTPCDADDYLTVHPHFPDIKIYSLPGHTLPHLGFQLNEHFFCGDTLFSLGCGRLFDGTADMLFDSLEQIKALPEQTLLYPTHEYTLDNLQFARHLLPDDRSLEVYGEQLSNRFDQDGLTLPVRLIDEKCHNPFLRCQEQVVQERVSMLSHLTVTQAKLTFAQMRLLKDRF